MNHSKYFDVALGAVKSAERIILQHYQPGIQTDLKSDQTPVTVADKEAEKIIRAHIRRNFPDHSILGEEEGSSADNSPFLWVIDPIDGTKNYLRQIPIFATQVALMENGEVILGISNAPARQELMYAEKGRGAFFNDQPLAVSKINQVSEAYMSYGSIGYFDDQGWLGSLLKLDKTTRAHRNYGDFWSYHLLAQGKIDIVIEAKVRIWDVAALSLIIEEAGGHVTDISGQTINPTTTTVIATNGNLHSEVCGYFAKQ